MYARRVAGRIRDEDIQRVREVSRIDEVIGEYLQLRNAGGDNLKGLCPFHDERSPSFNVRPSKAVFYCFGCGVGGDVLAFVMRHDHLTFAEAVERLAARANIQLRYEEGPAVPRGQQGQRTRLLEAHRAAHEYFREQLTGAEAAIARQFLAERGFDGPAVDQFQLGYAPRGWENLVRHLRGRRFSDTELLTAGLVSEGRHGPMDRFRGRLLWPIRDVTGDVIGFGARRLAEDDNGPKYLNTPETPLYKKSTVLYGLDLAKREIARSQQAVVVEGYTDVMACHLSGVTTAIATCGTAFGADHIRLLRRLLMDDDNFRGEVVFTFDGDEAGRKAALRAFEEDARFVTQTYVAVEPTGKDPCELRQSGGDAAVRELVARRIPLYEFALRSSVDRFDVTTAEGQIGALDAAAPIVASIRDWSLRQRYAVKLAGWIGLADEAMVLRRIGQQARPAGRGTQPQRPPAQQGFQSLVDPKDPRFEVERQNLKIALQYPVLAGPAFDETGPDAFLCPPYRAVRSAIAAAGGVVAAGSGEGWMEAVARHTPDDAVRALVTELAVESLPTEQPSDPRYIASILAKLRAVHVTRRTAEVKARLERINPVTDAEEYRRVFGELMALEQYRRALTDQSHEGG